MKELETIQKTISKAEAKELISRKNLSVDDALLVLSYYDSVLKEAGKFRQKELTEEEINEPLVNSGGARIIGTAGVGAFASATLGVTIDPYLAMLMCLCIIPGALGVEETMLLPFKKKISSRKSKSKAEELRAENRLRELKEAEYRKFANKVLKKVGPALKVINSSLPTEEFVYSSVQGFEGFELKPRNFTKWEKAKISTLQPEATEPLLELEQTKISLRKEIEA